MNDFVGVWKTDQRDPSQDPQDGDVTIHFKKDGIAQYAIYYSNHRDVVNLLYEVAHDALLLSQPNKDKLNTKFAFEPDGSLLLWFNGVKGRFIKTPHLV
jgi:hypothetical protein